MNVAGYLPGVVCAKSPGAALFIVQEPGNAALQIYVATSEHTDLPG